MTRRVFFSFHHGKDVFRANVVRNSQVILKDGQDRKFVDKAEFEKIKNEGENAVKKWIDKQMEGTSITIVLIGEETSKRPFVQYEIEHSIEKGNVLLGVKIHNIICAKEQCSSKEGKNPLPLSAPIYDWINDNGKENIEKWIEEAYDISTKNIQKNDRFPQISLPSNPPKPWG